METKFLNKKSHSAEKTGRGYPLVSPGIECYAEKGKRPAKNWGFRKVTLFVCLSGNVDFLLRKEKSIGCKDSSRSVQV